jgi:hypothetical protein
MTTGGVCRSQFLLALARAVILRKFEYHIILSQIRDFPNQEGQVPVFISPRNRVVWLYPEALGSIFVASYDSQGYCGDIRTRLHTRSPLTSLFQLLGVMSQYIADKDTY